MRVVRVMLLCAALVVALVVNCSSQELERVAQQLVDEGRHSQAVDRVLRHHDIVFHHERSEAGDDHVLRVSMPINATIDAASLRVVGLLLEDSEQLTPSLDVSAALIALAAAAGDAVASAEMGFRAAYGLPPVEIALDHPSLQRPAPRSQRRASDAASDPEGGPGQVPTADRPTPPTPPGVGQQEAVRKVVATLRDGGSAVTFGAPRVPEAVATYFMAASRNDTRALVALGFRHLHGHSVPKSCETAVLYYMRAAAQVMPGALHEGSKPLTAHERVSRASKAAKWPMWLQQTTHSDILDYFHVQAQRGDTPAKVVLGRLLAFGTQRHLRDTTAARKFLVDAAEAGEAQAMGHLGNLQAAEAVASGQEEAFEHAAKWLQRAAEQGSADGLFGSGTLHLLGLGGVQRDPAQARALLTRAAKSGHVEAHFFLGLMQRDGLGGPKDSKEAARNLMRAVAGGSLLASHELAALEMQDRDAFKDACPRVASLLRGALAQSVGAAAVRAATRAFKQGQAEAALLHSLRAVELGVEGGAVDAAWLLEQRLHDIRGAKHASLALRRRAAAEGDLSSLLILADAYYSGDGIDMDRLTAARLYERAAPKSAQARFNLGMMYHFGLGLPVDHHLSERHYDDAVALQPKSYLPVDMALWALRTEASVVEWLKGPQGRVVARAARESGLSDALCSVVDDMGLGDWRRAFAAKVAAAQEDAGTDGGAEGEAVAEEGAGGTAGREGARGAGALVWEARALMGLASLLMLIVWVRRRRRRRRRPAA
ncbi:unnamed protein product [Pedinophyceae sp. YPF-701]|nr:unnamed protein product [Pedinophyceae sp. YPF-701]